LRGFWLIRLADAEMAEKRRLCAPSYSIGPAMLNLSQRS
jgi:hypothetical protein